MAIFEFFDRSGDTGMLVVASRGVDVDFRLAADKADRPDQALLDVRYTAELSAPARLLEASRPLGECMLGLSDADRQSLIRAA